MTEPCRSVRRISTPRASSFLIALSLGLLPASLRALLGGGRRLKNFKCVGKYNSNKKASYAYNGAAEDNPLKITADAHCAKRWKDNET